MLDLAKRTLLVLLFLLEVSFIAFGQSQADQIVGDWLTTNGRSKVQIYKSDNKYFGKIIWLKEPTENGKPKLDKNNPDAKKKSLPLIGLNLLRGFSYDGDNVWEDGKIYDPENGKDYSCKMTLVNKSTLEVRGFIGFSLIGRTVIWTRITK